MNVYVYNAAKKERLLSYFDREIFSAVISPLTQLSTKLPCMLTTKGAQAEVSLAD